MWSGILENIYNKSTSSLSYIWKQSLRVIVFRDHWWQPGNKCINIKLLFVEPHRCSECFKDMQQCRALCFVAARGQRDLMLWQTLTTAQGPAGPRPRGNSQHATLHSWCGMIPFPFGSRLHFFTPTQKNWKSTANMFNVSHANIKMGKRACILSFILHKPFAWTRTEKNRHENWVEWFWNISKWREKERSFSTPGQAGSFGLIKTNMMRAGGLEALGKAVSGDEDFNPAVARHTDISNPSAFLKQST